EVSVEAQERAGVRGEKELEAAGGEAERVLRHLDTLEVEGRQLAGESATAQQELGSLEERMARVAAREGEIEREMGTLRDALEADQAEEASIVARATACRVDLATVLERVEALGREIDSLGEIGVECARRFEEASHRRSQLLERRDDLSREQAHTHQPA